MFAEEIRRAIPATPRVRLADLSAAVWKGFACGAIAEADAQQLADEIHARKAIPSTPAPPRKPVGSRPRSPAHMERRRRWTGSGWLPPHLACRFTMAETAVLSTIAAEVARRGLCRLTIGHIAVMAGVSRTTVQTAVRQAVAIGILTSEEWRLTAWRNAPNTVRIVSPEWRTWLRMRDRKRAADHPRNTEQAGIPKRDQMERSLSDSPGGGHPRSHVGGDQVRSRPIDHKGAVLPVAGRDWGIRPRRKSGAGQ